MSNEMFKELEKAINEEFKVKGLDIKIKIKGFENGGFLTDLSRKSGTIEEFQKMHEGLSIVWKKLMKKWFREF